MPFDRKEIYEFGEYRLDVDERTIERLDGVPSAALPDKTFETLVMLVRKRGHLVSKDDLLRHVWPDTIVEENNLEKRVHALRQFLSKSEERSGFIETVRGHGYRFVGRVEVVEVSQSWLPESLRILEADTQGLAENTAGSSGPNGHVAKAATGVAGDDEVGANKPWASKKILIAACGAGVLVIAAVLGYFGFVRTSSKSPRTIVILPAVSMSIAERNELLEVGIADSIINSLAAADGLIVRPLSSVREYAGSNVDPIEVGREQRAHYVLAANYQVAGGRIKVTSQLFNVSNGKIEETFQSQHDVANVFSAQDAIAADLGSKLMGLLGVSPGHPVRARGTNNEDAYRAYVQGSYILDKRDAGALEYMDKAVTLDPNYAKAWAGKALTHSQAADSRNDEDFTKANEAIRNALTINPDQSEAYTALCHLRGHSEWDAAGAEEACLRAIELDSTSAIARQTYSLLLGSRGRADESFAQVKIVMELEPASYINQVYYANLLYFARRLDEAVAQYRTVVDLKPERVATYNWFVRALEAQGKESEAFEWFIKSLIVEKKDDETIRRFKTAYESFGYKGVLLERIKTLDRDSPFRKAGLFARIGDKDKAFEMLEESYKERSWQMAILLPIEPQLDPIRNDPRYEDLLRRVEGR